ncbi:MAG: hypothetical protein QOJ84_1427 [Bradyrhizobium sp.]|jgi:hypothetical protein|nr:hypothetical protein [Bradyrhizobium sp.]
MATVSFANDIAPTLFKYRGQMAWRLDLASYDDVKANAAIIQSQITSNPPGMPPPPFDPFPQTFVDAFNTWITTDFPP